MYPLSLFLVGVAILCSLNPASADPWTDFQGKYIVNVPANDVGDDFCTKTIKAMNIKNGLELCKSKHEFINEKPENILAVCITKTHVNVKSGAAYNVIQCALDKMSETSNCIYTTTKLKRHILLECGDRQPVKFIND